MRCVLRATTTWIIAAILFKAFATSAAAQQAGSPRGIRLEFPDGVDLTGLEVRYYLHGSFGYFGGGVSAKPGVRAYDVPATVPYFSNAGKLAKSMNVMIYVPGYRFVLLADSGFGDGPPKTVRVPLEPLGVVSLSGKISGIADTANLTIEVSYLAYWAGGFLGYIDGPVPEYRVASTTLAADGSFTVNVPDFSHDPAVWRMPALPNPGAVASAPVQQDTLDRGGFGVWARDTRTGAIRYGIGTSIRNGEEQDIPIATAYPSRVALFARQGVDFPGYLSPTVRARVGERFTYNCRENRSLLPVGRLYGTDTYTEDSGVCAAAVHAGLFPYNEGGFVTIEIRAGQSSYAGSTRNGVTSESRTGGSAHSFVLVR